MADYLSEITKAVREADNAFETVGGSTRHWVRECLLPALQVRGFVIIRLNSLTPAAARRAAEEMEGR